jgi:hypothetical protein
MGTLSKSPSIEPNANSINEQLNGSRSCAGHSRERRCRRLAHTGPAGSCWVLNDMLTTTVTTSSLSVDIHRLNSPLSCLVGASARSWQVGSRVRVRLAPPEISLARALGVICSEGPAMAECPNSVLSRARTPPMRRSGGRRCRARRPLASCARCGRARRRPHRQRRRPRPVKLTAPHADR